MAITTYSSLFYSNSSYIGSSVDKTPDNKILTKQNIKDIINTVKKKFMK